MDVNNEAAQQPAQSIRASTPVSAGYAVNALLGGSEQQPVTQITLDGEEKLSVTEAARALAGARQKQKDQPQPSGPRAEGAAPHEVAQEFDPRAGG